MSTALWIGIPALLVLIALWRLRRAARTLRRILAEEASASETNMASPEANTPGC